MTNGVDYTKLFERYVSRLEWAVEQARGMRESELENLEQSFDGDGARAQEELDAMGILASDPYILGAIREHWLACAASNERDPAHRVEPSELIFKWLEQVRPDLAEIIAELPYWPIGTDAEGRWI